MNPKLQKVNREIERAKEKIAELQALLPTLEATRTKLENAEVIKVFRSADVAPDEFTAFIAAYRANMNTGAPLPEAPASAAPIPETNETENISSDEE